MSRIKDLLYSTLQAKDLCDPNGEQFEDCQKEHEAQAPGQGGGGTGLPSDVGAYKYMATDGEGNWVAADRLGYEYSAVVAEVLPETTYQTEEDNGAAVAVVEEINIEVGKKYRVLFDGKSYEKEAVSLSANGIDTIILGAEIDIETGYKWDVPFAFARVPLYNVCSLSTQTVGTYTASIQEIGTVVKTIPEEYIPERQTYPVTTETIDGVEKWVCGLDFATAWDMSPESLRESLTYRDVQDNPIECAKINSRHGQYWILHFHPMSVNPTTNVLSEETVYLKWDSDGITEVTTE